MSSRILSRFVFKVVYSNLNTTWVTDQKMVSYTFTKIIKEADKNWHSIRIELPQNYMANLWLGHQFTFGVVTWYVDIFIGQSVGTQNVTRRATTQETQTNGRTFSYALISMSNLKLLCRMDSIADVKRFVN